MGLSNQVFVRVLLFVNGQYGLEDSPVHHQIHGCFSSKKDWYKSGIKSTFMAWDFDGHCDNKGQTE